MADELSAARELSGEAKRELLARMLARRAPAASRYPLSFAQRRLWFLAELDPLDPAYNLLNAYRLRGRLEAGLLRAALAETVRRQAALRTRFALSGREPEQVVAPAMPVALPCVDLGGLDAARRLPEARRLASVAARAPYDLETGPLFRCLRIVLAAGDQVLVMLLHHIVADIWSFRVINHELAVHYQALLAGRAAALPPPALQYGDFAAWERGAEHARELEPQLAYWRCQLAGLEPLELPADRPRPPVQTSRGAALVLALPLALGDRLAGTAAELEASAYMLSLAAFLALLARHTGRSDLSCGSPVANRHRRELEPLVGLFVNTVVMRVDAAGDPTFRELAARVRHTAVAAYAHPEAPFERLVEELGVARDLSRNPLHQVVFQHGVVPPLELAGVDAESCLLLDYGVARADFELHLLSDRAALLAVAVYNADLYDAATAARLLGHFGELLRGALARPDCRLSGLSWLGAGERAQVLREWNDTAAPATVSLHERVAAWAAVQPDAPALEYRDGRWSYGELAARTAALAATLRGLGVGAETVVAIYSDRRPEMVLGALATLAAGGAFLPLDPTYPPERLSFILADAAAPVLLTVAALADALPAGTYRSLVLDAVDAADAADAAAASAGAGRPAAAVPAAADPDGAAYLVYTSGSTGRPKGVVALHRGLANLTACHGSVFGSGPGSRVLQFSSPGFDGWLGEAAIALGAGAALRLAPAEELLPGPELVRRMAAWGITHAALPPSSLAMMDEARLPDLACLIVAGEACPQAVADLWGARRRLFNNYGPTECTVGATIERHRTGARFTIGRPMPNTEVLVLDRLLQAAGVGTPGELCLGGRLLARGYWRRPDLTAERFVPHPHAAEPGARLYRTGDLVRWLPDGRLEFLGRIDQQIKMRGFRIEVEEIETVLREHPAVREAAVAVWEPRAGDLPGVAPMADRPADRRLAAYVVLDEGAAAGAPELRRHLRGKLPEYMVPAAFVILPALPRTPHGKVDRRALPAPATIAAAAGESHVPPAGALEERVAGLWREVLLVEHVGAQDNFFDLGGNSLLMALLRRQLQSELGIEIAMVDLFRHATVRAMAAFLAGGEDGAAVVGGVERGELRRDAASRRRQRVPVAAAGGPR
jgi:amino acid adenylation domain-containing protein